MQNRENKFRPGSDADQHENIFRPEQSYSNIKADMYDVFTIFLIPTHFSDINSVDGKHHTPHKTIQQLEA